MGMLGVWTIAHEESRLSKTFFMLQVWNNGGNDVAQQYSVIPSIPIIPIITSIPIIPMIGTILGPSLPFTLLGKGILAKNRRNWDYTQPVVITSTLPDPLNLPNPPSIEPQ